MNETETIILALIAVAAAVVVGAAWSFVALRRAARRERNYIHRGPEKAPRRLSPVGHAIRAASVAGQERRVGDSGRDPMPHPRAGPAKPRPTGARL